MIPVLRPALLPAALLLIAHPFFGVELTDRPEPGVPRLNQARFDTQDYVITTHDVRDYGATANDESDDTEVFQKAIDACEQDGGGVIFVPAGRYVFRNRLVLKSGVYLRGEWKNPETGPAAGTLLCIYYGRGEPAALPFITMGYNYTGYINLEMGGKSPSGWEVYNTAMKILTPLIA